MLLYILFTLVYQLYVIFESIISMFELKRNARLDYKLSILVLSGMFIRYYYLTNYAYNVDENKLYFQLVEVMVSIIFGSTLGIINIDKKDGNREIIKKLDEIHDLLLEIRYEQSDENNIKFSDKVIVNETSDDNNIESLDETDNESSDEKNVNKSPNFSLLSDKINEIKSPVKKVKRTKNLKNKSNIIDLTNEKIIEVKHEEIRNKHINEFIELLSDASIDTEINNHDLINLKKNLLTKIKLTM